MGNSLVEIGRHRPDVVWDIASRFLEKNKGVESRWMYHDQRVNIVLQLIPVHLQADKAHRVVLLDVMKRIVELRRDAVDEDIAGSLTERAIAEMTADRVSSFLVLSLDSHTCILRA